MRAVITGGAGFIGSHLSEACIGRGWSVTAIDAFTDYYPEALKRSNIEALVGRDGFRLIEADLAVDRLEPLLEGADIVFHLAAQPGVRASWGTTFDAYTNSNVVALQRLLETLKDASGLRKFVFASSSSVYGNAEQLPTPESASLAPVSPYGATKVLGEHLCALYRRSYDMPVVTLRYFSVYGPRQRPDMAFSRLIDSALRGTEVALYGDGSQTRDFTYVADVVAATVAAAELAPAGAVYNVGGGSRMPLAEAIELITDEVGRRPSLCLASRQRGDARDTAADTARIARELEFVPTWDVARGLAEQIAWQSSRARLFAAPA
jgi:nucleoside-diphosphate-sugar epimerase